MDYGTQARVFTTFRVAFSSTTTIPPKPLARLRRHAQFRRSVDLALTGPVRCSFSSYLERGGMTIQVERAHGLEALGIVRAGRVHWNLGTAALYEEALRRSEGNLAAEGPLVCKTGQHQCLETCRQRGIP